jgi:predicted DNA-binding transcriptional regulator AlpA
MSSHDQPLANSARQHLRVQEVAERARRSVSVIWDVTNKNSKNFDPRAPKRIPVTRRCTRFSAAECDAWLAALESGGE